MEKLLGKLYTVTNVAQMLGINVKVIYKWINEGKLTAIKLGGTTWRVREQDLKLFSMNSITYVVENIIIVVNMFDTKAKVCYRQW
ncbi:helix-turn-helix domain-containing protein [Brevibacillus sp. NRS-1366]|uniref:helix-turn-helix domain-containing protein n=1 Tax=Brevibacillus sp. NRS-1366 TaxID=3233899 RepID=UPI003D1CF7D1